jgi:hypothetical protein
MSRGKRPRDAGDDRGQPGRKAWARLSPARASYRWAPGSAHRGVGHGGGHAETGRVWQSGGFWQQADSLLLADGALPRLHEEYQTAAILPASAGPSRTP